jgi:hypothetical protein
VGVERQSASGSSGDKEPPLGRPDWDDCICHRLVNLRDAVALSCNIDPGASRVHFAHEGDNDPRIRLFIKRLRIAEEEARNGGAFRAKWHFGPHGDHLVLVNLVQFATWAVGLERSRYWNNLPKEFKQLVPRKAAPAKARQPTPETKQQEPAVVDASEPNVESMPQRLALAATSKPAAQKKPKRLASADVQNSANKGKVAATKEGRYMLIIILALVTEIQRTNERISSDVATVRRLLKNAKQSLTPNTIKKFLNEAKALKPAESPLENTTAEYKPVDTSERKSMLRIILALVIEIEKRLAQTLTGVKLLGFVEDVGYRLPVDTITTFLNEAKIFMPPENPPGSSNN